jgi:hypothetical protein
MGAVRSASRVITTPASVITRSPNVRGDERPDGLAARPKHQVSGHPQGETNRLTLTKIQMFELLLALGHNLHLKLGATTSGCADDRNRPRRRRRCSPAALFQRTDELVLVVRRFPFPKR